MTSFLRGRRPLAATSGAGALSWRQVPKVDFLPDRRPSALQPAMLGLLALILVAAVVALYLYLDLSALEDRVTVASSDLDKIEALKAAEDAAISDELEKIDSLEKDLGNLGATGGLVTEAYLELAQDRADWGYALDALLRADSPEVRFRLVTAKPGRKMEALGTATGVAALGQLQQHMLGVEDVLGLERLHWEPGDSALAFTADLVVK